MFPVKNLRNYRYIRDATAFVAGRNPRLWLTHHCRKDYRLEERHAWGRTMGVGGPALQCPRHPRTNREASHPYADMRGASHSEATLFYDAVQCAELFQQQPTTALRNPGVPYLVIVGKRYSLIGVIINGGGYAISLGKFGMGAGF